MEGRPPLTSSETRVGVAVIGSGPGGAIAALRLAEAGVDVVMIEEGPFLPLDSAPHFSRAEILQKYRNAGVNVTLGSAKVAWVEGRCVGGGSEVNRGLYHRTPDDVLETWRSRFRIDAMDVDGMAPHFEACESILEVSHLPGEAPVVSRKLLEGSTALGWKCVEVPRLFSYSTDPSKGLGRKQSMTEIVVPRFLEAGGRLVHDTRIRRIARSGGRWLLRGETGGYAGNRRSVLIEADTVILACGAVQTPALLRRSGVTRNVGNTLRFHPMVKVVARFADEVNFPSDLEPVHQVKEFDPRFSMGCSISKRPALALALVDRPEVLPEVDTGWRHMAIYYAQTTGGQASVRPLPGYRDPLVLGKKNPEDARDLAEAVKNLARCLFAAGAEAVYPGYPGLPPLRSEADLEVLPDVIPPASGGITTMHLFSSCPMGEDHGQCAVDSFGRVHGVDGLFVADASILPGPTVVNPQGTVMAMSHRVSGHMLESLRRPRKALATA